MIWPNGQSILPGTIDPKQPAGDQGGSYLNEDI